MLGTSLHGLLIDCHSSDRCNEGCLWNPKGRKDNNVKRENNSTYLINAQVYTGSPNWAPYLSFTALNSTCLQAWWPKFNPWNPHYRKQTNKKLFSDFHVLTSATQHPPLTKKKNESINKIYFKKIPYALKGKRVFESKHKH